jgi:hypothetical protein
MLTPNPNVKPQLWNIGAVYEHQICTHTPGLAVAGKQNMGEVVAE